LAHVLRVFLIDSERRIRNIYSPSFLHPDLVLNDVRTLLAEAPPGPISEPMSDSEPVPVSAHAVTAGPGDNKTGYERPDYRTRSLSLAVRRGRPMDLLANLQDPPLGLPPVPVPADAPVTPEKVAIGRKLFFDRRLSLNGTVSCAMCHIPEQGFASNELRTAVGIEGRTVRRNAPGLFNAGYSDPLFHDGRETRLEHQVWEPLLAANEMGNPSIASVVEKVRRLPDYQGLFEDAFARGPTMETIGQALASYERTLNCGDSPFDRWYYGSDQNAIAEAAERGFAVFMGKGGCAGCHPIGPEHALFTDGALHNTGIGYLASMEREPAMRRIQVAPGVALDVAAAVIGKVSEAPPSDLGRYEITLDPDDRWKYKTPSLRNLTLTAPYMHDGSIATLAEVVAFYDGGGIDNPLLDPRIRRLDLSAREQTDLVAFLETLTGRCDDLVADAFAAPVGDARPDDPPWWE
jgi:cytochrome c peroxidase